MPAQCSREFGQGRASELLLTGRFMPAEEGERWGFFSRVVESSALADEAQKLARQIGTGPTYANTMTKRMLAMEWAMSVEEAIEAEAVAQALCMTTEDFARAFRAFQPKRSRCSREIDVIDPSFLAWPFFEDRHRHFADSLNAWAQNEI